MQEEQAKTIKQKPGPKPATAPADRPHLASEWSHLRAWWAVNGGLYNVREIGRLLEMDHIALGRLLKGEGRHAATADKFDAIVSVLTRRYTPLIEK